MCVGAIVHSRKSSRVVYGATTQRPGAVESGPANFDEPSALTGVLKTRGGLLAEPCSSVYQVTFLSHRRELRRQISTRSKWT